jgi:hypothetical protein
MDVITIKRLHFRINEIKKADLERFLALRVSLFYIFTNTLGLEDQYLKLVPH